MTTCVLFACVGLLLSAEVSPRMVVVIGAEGTAEYGQQFRQWAGRWEGAAKRGGAEFTRIGLDESGKTTDRDLLQKRLADSKGENSEPLWLVLIGHGTFDGKTARFNLRGPDVTATELAQWLKPVSRPLVIIDC